MIPERVADLVAEAKKAGKSIVLVTGVFDVLHQEHTNFLLKAKQAGDVLLVGLECDVRVRQIKGEGRPVNPEVKRLQTLENLHIADAVFILPEAFNRPEHYRQLLKETQPDILAVSSHTDHLDVKQQMMAAVGGRVEVVHEHNPAVSTTILLSNGYTD